MRIPWPQSTWVYYYFLGRRSYHQTPAKSAKWASDVVAWWDDMNPNRGYMPSLEFIP